MLHFQNTFSLSSSFNTRNQVSKARKTTGEMKNLFSLIFTYLDRRREDYEPNGTKHSANLIFS